jgi:SAM-dependent methyltransferase
MTATPTATAPNERGYVFSNAKATAAERLALLARIFDPITQNALAPIVARGAHCWEVGAGNGTIATWLLDRVGEHGCVLATDLDPRFLEPLARPNLIVRRHDVVNDPIPETRFDLIHARLLLCHLPERETVLQRLISALNSGGWLVVEDFDSLSLLPDPTTHPSETPLRTMSAMRQYMEDRGVDLRFARTLSAKMRQYGLAAVNAEGRVFMNHSGSAFTHFQRLTLEQLRDDLITGGHVTASEFADDMAALEQRYMAPSPVFWSVIGKRP